MPGPLSLTVTRTTPAPVSVCASTSTTGVMEAAIVNCFSAGDTVIVCRNGKFGDRQKKIAETYGLNVVDLQYGWTEVVRPDDVAKALSEHPEARGVIVTQSETSSGVLNDVKAIGEIVGPMEDVVLIVDSITGIGAVECKTDEWNLDVVMTGSQKGLMLPPGLAACTVSKKAWKAYERSTLPKFYFDWMSYQKNVAKDTTPFTPAVTLVLGLNEALKMIREEGIENTIIRHSKLAEATRRGCEALGLKLFAPPEGRGSAVTPSHDLGLVGEAGFSSSLGVLTNSFVGRNLDQGAGIALVDISGHPHTKEKLRVQRPAGQADIETGLVENKRGRSFVPQGKPLHRGSHRGIDGAPNDGKAAVEPEGAENN